MPNGRAPVKPLTTPMSNFCAALAVFFISSARTLDDTDRIAIAPDVAGQDSLMAFVNWVANSLATQGER